MGLLTVAVLGVLHALVGWGPQLLVSATSLVDPNEAMFAGVPVGEALVGSVAAGVGEEVLVLAVPFVLLERAGLTGRRIGRFPMGLVVVGVVLVAARMAFHIYRGWVSVQFLPWAIGSVIVFFLTRSLIALIIAHAVWDTAVLLLPRLPVYADTGWVWYVTLGTLAALGIAATVLLARRHQILGRWMSLDTRPAACMMTPDASCRC